VILSLPLPISIFASYNSQISDSIQFSFIYIAPNHNKGHLKAL